MGLLTSVEQRRRSITSAALREFNPSATMVE
jgi:hypothetical protein